MADDATRWIKVWDPLLRLFHWSLVIAFFAAYLTGDELQTVHLWAGYLITGLLAFRLLWGFIGPRHARFSDFLYSRAEIGTYLRDLAAGRPRRYLGHNPAGAVMVFLLLGSLILTAASGLALEQTLPEPTAQSASWFQWEDDEDEHEGEGNEILEELHEFFANLTLLLVLLHIAGVAVSSRLHHENLVRAMITGRKPAKPEQ